VSLYDDAVAQLTGWTAPTSAQAALRASYLAHLRDHPDGLTRDCHPDHITASLIVLNRARDRVLLNLHAKYQIWVQLGGHCDPGDDTLAGAALREGVEESGIAALTLVGSGPAQLSTHEVRCGPVRPSHHLDVRYIALAPPGAEPVVSSESLDVRWFDIDALPAGLEPELHELISIARGA
jgi:8-oxo-dGTP pyrophosphatase MutT (NUDIX family)